MRDLSHTAPPGIQVLKTVREMRGLGRRLRREGESLALVPTMGVLHEGHLSLIDRARDLADRVCVSVFVNPTQFGPGEDFERYPRDLDRDVGLAAARGASLIFAPAAAELYPHGQRVWVDPGSLGERLCGRNRPGHFRGVLTVVLKLFQLVRPEVAVFGAKDFQQSVLIRAMVKDLELSVHVDVAPVVRESDGLALSSRNVYLSAEERSQALSLSGALRSVRAAYAGGETRGKHLRAAASEVIRGAGLEPEYAEVVDAESLESLDTADAACVCAVAAVVGTTRLIDNAVIGGPSSL